MTTDNQTTNTGSEPVVREDTRDYSLTALVGRETVVLGWTVADNIDRSDLLGFGVKRSRFDLDSPRLLESRWVTQERHFNAHNGHGRRQLYSTRTDPLQQFSWCDISVEAGFRYEYSVVPVRGTPALMQFEAPVMLELSMTASLTPTRQSATPTRGVSSPDKGAAAAAGVDTARALFGDTEYLDSRHIESALVELAGMATSCIFVYSPIPLGHDVAKTLADVGPDILVYGIAPCEPATSPCGRIRMLAPNPSVEAGRFALSNPLDAYEDFNAALVIDPWGDAPQTLLWDNAPAATRQLASMSSEPRIAADVAAAVFRSFLSRQAAAVARPASPLDDLLLTDGRWSGIYFSPSSASHKCREREVLAGQP